MFIFDAHNDLLTQMFFKKAGLYDNLCHIDFLEISKNKNLNYGLCCAIFVNKGTNLQRLKITNKIIDNFYNKLGEISSIAGVLNSKKNINIVLSIEGADCVGGDPDKVEQLFKRGVRAVGLTWNNSNELAAGCNDKTGGISKKGKTILDKMNEIGMILDLSHIGEKSFFEAIEYFPGKIIASHSNVWNICPNKRNLTDNQIKLIKEREGVIGINLYPPFLNQSERAKLIDVMKHIEYISGKFGIDCVGFGFDFDGVDELPEGITGFKDVDKILEELGKLNYTENEIKKICGENFNKIFFQG